MKYYVINRGAGIKHYYRTTPPDGEVQHLWRTKWVACAYECLEDLLSDGAELGEFDPGLN